MAWVLGANLADQTGSFSSVPAIVDNTACTANVAADMFVESPAQRPCVNINGGENLNHHRSNGRNLIMGFGSSDEGDTALVGNHENFLNTNFSGY